MFGVAYREPDVGLVSIFHHNPGGVFSVQKHIVFTGLQTLKPHLCGMGGARPIFDAEAQFLPPGMEDNRFFPGQAVELKNETDPLA
jgi:hypothetical protein